MTTGYSRTNNYAMLSDSQYSSSKKYEARIHLHRKFRTNPKSQFEWIFDHFPKNENLTLLELGCGTGLFWLANRDSIRESWSIILSDYSEGMLEAARNSLFHVNRNFQYEIINAEDMKYTGKTFDVILANNMLYHVQNRDDAIMNIKRLLKDTGVFIVSTMGKNDLSELHNHLYVFLEGKNNKFRFRELTFSLDNGMEQLRKHFQNVEREKFDNKLVINEADAIIHYYLSFNGMYDNLIVLPEEHILDFKRYLRDILEKENVISTVKDEGVFICRK
jgi:ubiquinone/menaquinone biosynthesis C-methylase UbiE